MIGSDMQRNVILTGFMGTGKTVVGRLLAARLGFEFIDTDELIATRYGPIGVIFAESGEEGFREVERKVARELSGVVGHVIATGGRLMLDERNAALLGEGSRVFCLVASPAELIRRLGDSDDRPLLAGADRLRRIVDLLAERQPGYDRFEQIDTNGKNPDEVVAVILDRL